MWSSIASTTSRETVQIFGGLTIGIALAIYSNPQWYYNANSEYRKTGVKLQSTVSSSPEVSTQLSNNFFNFHKWEGVGKRDYGIKNEVLQMQESLVKDLTEASYELHSMCLEVVDRVVNDDVLLELFEIPEDLRILCKYSWQRRQADCLGRFDFLYDGKTKPKLLEYNADTPTLLIESGVAQNLILYHFAKAEGINNKIKHFNFIENSIINYWTNFFRNNKQCKRFVVTGDTQNEEDAQTLKYMHSLLNTALNKEGSTSNSNNIETHCNSISDLYHDEETGKITVKNLGVPDVLWKLYPYEWLNDERIGKYFENCSNYSHFYDGSSTSLAIVEPYWKLILSSKALLPLLWEMYPNHPNLLPAFFEHPKNVPEAEEFLKKHLNWVRKPKFGREGYKIEMNYSIPLDKQNQNAIDNGTLKIENVDVHIGKPIYQAYTQSITIQRMYPTFGVWIINGLPSGIGVRLCLNTIANTETSFISHYFINLNKFHFRCTDRQMNLRREFYGDDRNNADIIYEDFAKQIVFDPITEDSSYYKDYHSRTEVERCYCGGSCPSYSKAEKDVKAKENLPKGGRKFTNANASTSNRMSTGATSKAFSVKS